MPEISQLKRKQNTYFLTEAKLPQQIRELTKTCWQHFNDVIVLQPEQAESKVVRSGVTG